MTTSEGRWSDDVFRDPNLTPEQADFLDRRGAAMREYYRTGNPEPMREFGLDLADRTSQGQMDQMVKQARQAVPTDDAR